MLHLRPLRVRLRPLLCNIGGTCNTCNNGTIESKQVDLHHSVVLGITRCSCTATTYPGIKQVLENLMLEGGICLQQPFSRWFSHLHHNGIQPVCEAILG